MRRLVPDLVVRVVRVCGELAVIGEGVWVVSRRCQRGQRPLAREPRAQVDLPAEIGHDRVPRACLVLGKPTVALLAIR
jgi:hypothetical protein